MQTSEETLISGRRFITQVNDDGTKEYILTSTDGIRVAAVLSGPEVMRMSGIVRPERKTSDYYAAHPELNPCLPKHTGAINSATESH